MLKRSGLGFLSNKGDKTAENNVRIVYQASRKDGLDPTWMFLVAKRAIAGHDEILSPYNNRDPAVTGRCSLVLSFFCRHFLAHHWCFSPGTKLLHGDW
jgi:hypothetical protein